MLVFFHTFLFKLNTFYLKCGFLFVSFFMHLVPGAIQSKTRHRVCWLTGNVSFSFRLFYVNCNNKGCSVLWAKEEMQRKNCLNLIAILALSIVSINAWSWIILLNLLRWRLFFEASVQQTFRSFRQLDLVNMRMILVAWSTHISQNTILFSLSLDSEIRAENKTK